jgi:hypothetical protein
VSNGGTGGPIFINAVSVAAAGGIAGGALTGSTGASYVTGVGSLDQPSGGGGGGASGTASAGDGGPGGLCGGGGGGGGAVQNGAASGAGGLGGAGCAVSKEYF